MTERKGIILAGGTGSRLHPVTQGVSKQLLPVYDKPMIFYPLTALMLAGIREIAIITTPLDQPQFQRLLGDGSQWGLTFTWIVQPKPEGLAQAYLLAEDFLAGAGSAMVLGDNIFFGQGLSALLRDAAGLTVGGRIFGYRVSSPERYGVVECDAEGRVVSLVEKPEIPRSKFAVTGLYFLDGSAPKRARKIFPSARGELEIVSLLQDYLDDGLLEAGMLGRGYAWLDTGTFESLLDAGNFVRTLSERQGLQVGNPEEVAYLSGFIDAERLKDLADRMPSTRYGDYLRSLVR